MHSFLKQSLCAASLLALVASGSGHAQIQGGIPGQGELTVPEASAEEIASACKKIVFGLDNHPGFTVIAKGHSKFPELKDLKIGEALKKSCSIDDATWNRKPAHGWKTPEGRSLYTRKDLLPFVLDAAVTMTKKSSEPPYKKLFTDDPVVAAGLDKLHKLRAEEGIEINPEAPPPPRAPVTIPSAKDAGVLPATPEQVKKACRRIAAGIPMHEGLNFIFNSFEKVRDYEPSDIRNVFEQACGDMITEAAKKAPPINPEITEQGLIKARDNACERMSEILLDPREENIDDRVGLYAILDKDDYTRGSFAYACSRAPKPGSENLEPINDLGPAPLQAKFTEGRHEPAPAI
jgi:hypothetical protein